MILRNIPKFSVKISLLYLPFIILCSMKHCNKFNTYYVSFFLGVKKAFSSFSLLENRKNNLTLTLPSPFIYVSVAQTMMSEIPILPSHQSYVSKPIFSLLFGEHISLGVKYKVHFLQTSFSLKNYRKL